MISKKDKKILTVIFAVFLVLGLFYFAQNLYFKNTGTIETEYAFNYIQKEQLVVTGFTVRDENFSDKGNGSSILYQENGKVYVPVVSDSASVSSNSVIALAFSSESEAADYLELQELTEKLESLQELKSQGDLSYINVVYLNSGIFSSVENYVDSISLNSLEGFDSSANDFVYQMSTKQIATGDAINIDSQIDSLKSRINKLEKNIGSYSKITAPHAGYFISQTDGYENSISYSDVADKKVAVNDGQKLVSSAPETYENAYGKIIGQHTWYFIFDTSITDASVFKTGNYVSIDFPDSNIEDLDMKVHSVSELNGDNITVTLKCTSMNEDIAKLRIETANVTVSAYEGLRISNSALVQNDDGLFGVYVLLGSYVKFTPVDICYYGEDYVLANEYIAYKTDSDGNKVVDTQATESYRSLRLYDRIVVKGMNLEDGQIISR